jgi:hypothetical protein
MTTSWTKVSAGVLLLFALTSTLRANGCYIPEPAVPALPSIPLQRALIVHRNGIETLVVESSFDTTSRNVGWILPLPAEPTQLESADPGILTSLGMSMRPKIIHDNDIAWKFPLFLFVFMGIVTINEIFQKDPKKRSSTRKVFYLIAILGVFLYPCLLPAGLSLDRSGPIDTVSVVGMKRVGNYEVSVLCATSSSVLSKWLKDHSLSPLSSEAKAIADDYISRKWCFLAAKLQRDQNGKSTPHPILATFPAANPIFPMKLTRLANSTTRVELFCIADQQMAATGFHTAAADKFHSAGSYQQLANDTLASVYRGNNEGLTIGNPDVVKRMWPNSIATRLSADLTPQQMNADVQLQPASHKACRDIYFSSSSRWALLTGLLLLGGVFLLAYISHIFVGRRSPTRLQRRILVASSAIVLLAGVIFYLMLPVIPVKTGKSMRWFETTLLSSQQNAYALELFNKGWLKENLTPATIAEFPALVKKHYLKGDPLINPFTGQEIRPECSPGNYMVRKIEDKIHFCTYDIDGRERQYQIHPQQNPPQEPAH